MSRLPARGAEERERFISVLLRFPGGCLGNGGSEGPSAIDTAYLDSREAMAKFSLRFKV